MNILQINASYKPAFIYGGPTMSVAALTEQLHQAGCNVKVYTTTANGPAELPVAAGKTAKVDGIDVIYFKRLTKDHSHFSPALLRHMWRTVKQFNVVHIHAWWNLVSMGACLVARLRKVPVVVSPRGTLSAYSFTHKNSYFKRLLHELQGRALLNGSAIHVTSEHEKKAIKLLLKPKLVTNIPNFVNIPATIPPRAENQQTVLRLIFLSRIDAKKGIDILINALAQTQIPYRLTIAGDGDSKYVEQLKHQAERQGIAHNIDWTGFCHGNEKFTLLGQHHLLVLPSYDENFGNVVIESLSVGTPVLVSDKVGLAAYVAGNNLGWVCATTPQSVTQTLQEVWHDPAKRMQIQERAPQQIRQDFSPHVLVSQYIDLYQSVLK